MIHYCKKCITPSSRPRVTFNKFGICNACVNAKVKNKINWEKRRQEFLNIILEIKRKKSPYDCIIPWSGGKDSSAIAHKLKFQFNLNPLLVTASPLIPNSIGLHNREEMLKLGFDNLIIQPNLKISRYLSKRFLIERGNPKVHWEATKEAIPIQIALKYKIPYVFYAEHGESEYGGRVLGDQSCKTKDYTEVVENIVGDNPINWIDSKVNKSEINPYLYPSEQELKKSKINILYFSYFFRWSMYENFKYIKTKIDFKTAPGNRTDGTFTSFDSLDDKIDTLYYYMQFVKFGFGRAARDASRLIHNNHLTRKQGLRLVKKYDAEFPKTYLNDQLEYLQISRSYLDKIIDSHRNSEIWIKKGTNWLLRYPPK